MENLDLPSPKSKMRILPVFALSAAASWIWGDRGLLFHFFLSKIVLFVREYKTVINSGFQVLEGGVGIFGFGHFFGQYFGFCTENLRFFAFVSFAVSRFSFFWHLVFRLYGKNKAG